MVDSSVVIELNPRERRIYDRLRAQVIEAEPGNRSSIRDLLLLLPDLVVLLFRLMRDSRVPMGSKAIATLGAAYLLSPIDLMPSLLMGPIGLVDDLVVIGAVLSRMLNRVHPDVVRSHWSGQGDALEAIQRVSAWTERVFGDRVRQVSSWVSGSAR
ncbi:MAG: DUF1232 domain-containing protein [Myxococcota bacterium]|nr:DUF1232 domain-containing protein [Myxococcota bacterium]